MNSWWEAVIGFFLCVFLMISQMMVQKSCIVSYVECLDFGNGLYLEIINCWCLEKSHKTFKDGFIG